VGHVHRADHDDPADHPTPSGRRAPAPMIHETAARRSLSRDKVPHPAHGDDRQRAVPTPDRSRSRSAPAPPGSAGPGAAVDLLIHLPVVVALVNTAHPLDPDPALTGLDVLAWRAGEQLTTPVNDDPEYLRALFNTESTWAAAQTSEASK